MASKTKRNVDTIQEVDDQDRTCCLCAEIIKIWAIGECKHPVCYICSSRMRLLNKQMNCAICKSEMKQVIFHTSMFKHNSIKLSSLDKDDETGICFFSSDSREKFDQLRNESCTICTKENAFGSGTFEELKVHMRRKHDLHHCSLCFENYLLFPRERKWYSRKDLATHKMHGDRDDKSHKGHPKCEFCQDRFLDDHELYRHLRKDHFTCHICELQSGKREFMANVRDLVKHFRKDHFLCEHPICQESPMTSAYVSELELKIHISEKHGGIDKKDLRMEVGIARAQGQGGQSHEDRQRDIEEDIETRVNQHAPDVDSEEQFPTMGGVSKSGFTFHAAKTGMPTANTNLASKVGHSTGRNVSHQNYKSMSRNPLSGGGTLAEEFPTLGGGPVQAHVNKNWKAKAVQNNRPVGKTNFTVSTKKTKAPAKVTIPVHNSASAMVQSASEPIRWSQEPDRFVEKSQLQLEAEKRAAAAANKEPARGGGGPVQKDHSQFPSLGGGPSKPSAFWGVPGASIKKTNTGKKNNKKALPRPEVLPGQRSAPVKHKPAPSKPKTPVVAAFTPPPETAKEKRVESTIKRGEINSASDIAVRLSGGYSGWSAPPETFHEKSLFEIREERQRNQPKIKNPDRAPQLNEFPTLGGSKKKPAQAGFWGVPGAAVPKAANSGQSKAQKTTPKPKPQPATTSYAKNGKKGNSVAIDFNAPAAAPPVVEQNASVTAERMTGGYSGWSKPPTVFVEKSLIEIQDEERRRKQEESHDSVNWTPRDEGAFPTLSGGDVLIATPSVSGYSTMLSKEVSKVVKSPTPRKETPEHDNNKENEFNVQLSEGEFPAFEDIHIQEDEEDEEEEEPEIDMAAVNIRLRKAIGKMNGKNQNKFKLSSGKFRTGQITADEYVKEGSSIMSRKEFTKLLPDLLLTLPEGKHKRSLSDAYARL